LPISAFRTQILSLARLRCPRCHEGRVFRSLLDMHETCQTCGYLFEREPGFFVGAMYVSYALAVPLFGALSGLVWLFTRWPLDRVMTVACLVFLPLVPVIFRYSRVLWIHFDRAIDRS